MLASSGQIYGVSEEGSPPFAETDPADPQSPYAVSKLCSELLARQAWSGEQVPTVIMRTFNYTGPWQAPTFVCSDFARQVAWAEAGLTGAEMTVGNLDARRELAARRADLP